MKDPIWDFIEKNYHIVEFIHGHIRLSEHLWCISNEWLHITKQGIYIELEPKLSYNGQSPFIFKLILRHDKVEGVLVLCSSIDLSDEICVAFYNHNIGILNIDYDGNYRKVEQKYDQDVIIRRHTIVNIVNH